MKTLSLIEMEDIRGGGSILGCIAGVLGFGSSMWGLGAAMVAASTGIGTLLILGVLAGASVYGLGECN